MINGLAATASAIVSAWSAPWETRGRAFEAVLFQTVVGCPSAMNAVASALPIEPSPRTVTGVWWSVMRLRLSWRKRCDKYLLFSQVLTLW
jgi:hypothetical protein